MEDQITSASSHLDPHSTDNVLDSPAGAVRGAPEKGSAAGGPSLHEEIVAKIRSFVVESNLPGGARIPERELCERFGISRTPIREALKVLASEGLVDLLPNRGSRVRSLSEDDLRDLFDLMGGLESLAGRLACECVTDEEVAEIEALHHKMYTHYLRRNLPDYFRINQLIHERIVAAARNPALSALYSGNAGRLRKARYAANLATTQDRLSNAMREHEAILDCLRRRAGAELADVLFHHLRNKRVAILSDAANPGSTRSQGPA
jgi:DNA-binding GntR family transcriptional regulator